MEGPSKKGNGDNCMYRQSGKNPLGINSNYFTVDDVNADSTEGLNQPCDARFLMRTQMGKRNFKNITIDRVKAKRYIWAPNYLPSELRKWKRTKLLAELLSLWAWIRTCGWHLQGLCGNFGFRKNHRKGSAKWSSQIRNALSPKNFTGTNCKYCKNKDLVGLWCAISNIAGRPKTLYNKLFSLFYTEKAPNCHMDPEGTAYIRI